MRIYQFGSIDNPQYKTYVGPYIAPKDAALDGNFRPAWCCPFEKGHKTAKLAANHAARLAVAEWERSDR